ncbi:MAG TPA: sulfatase-like hydrolase/transferase, partial [Tepidisphaeraceae bacterium]|nr:sulfatase-like hydrolase/transferase [Tepidisphaeraceae bacterium]
HTPILPTPEFAGKSSINPYADFVMETDYYIGQVLKTLDGAHLAGNTLVIFASDNGCSPAANFAELARHGHNPSYVFRGEKSDIWDGGHHIPFIARWPDHIKPGTSSGQLVCLNDFMATAAEITGLKLPSNAGEDSVSLLAVFLGKDKGPVHDAVIHHSIDGMFAVRQGPWKLDLCPGSGGWSLPTDRQAVRDHLPPMQLYRMDSDIGEKTNVYSSHPEVVAHLTRILEDYIRLGRSTPGEVQHNDVPINIHKQPKPLPPLEKRIGD